MYSGYKSLVRYVTYKYFFHSVEVSFCSTNIFNFDDIQFIFFLFVTLFLVNLKSCCLTQGPEDLLLCFLLRVYGFSSFIFSDPFWVNFCVWCREGYHFILFCVGVSLSSIICYKDSSPPFEWPWCPCRKSAELTDERKQHDKEKASKWSNHQFMKKQKRIKINEVSQLKKFKK